MVVACQFANEWRQVAHVFQGKKFIEHGVFFVRFEIAVTDEPIDNFFDEFVTGMPGSIFDLHPTGCGYETLHAHGFLGETKGATEVTETVA